MAGFTSPAGNPFAVSSRPAPRAALSLRFPTSSPKSSLSSPSPSLSEPQHFTSPMGNAFITSSRSTQKPTSIPRYAESTYSTSTTMTDEKALLLETSHRSRWSRTKKFLGGLGEHPTAEYDRKHGREPVGPMDLGPFSKGGKVGGRPF